MFSLGQLSLVYQIFFFLSEGFLELPSYYSESKETIANPP